MKKTELVQKIASRLERPPQDVKACLEAITDEITDALARGERVTLTGFGTFQRTWSPPRQARNPRSGRLIQLHPRFHARFSAGASVQQRLKALIPTFDHDPDHVKARRVARTLAADLKLYHQDLIKETRRAGAPGDAMQEILASLYETFNARVPAHIIAQRNYLEEELTALLKKGRVEPTSGTEQAS